MLAYIGLPLDLFGKVDLAVLFRKVLVKSFSLGCLLPTISAIATARPPEGFSKLALWKY